MIAAEWRGCGDSDKPEPASDYSNYSMATHAQDMLNLLDALGIRKCHLYGHSTGGIICSYMLVKQPRALRQGADARPGHAARAGSSRPARSTC